jgi:type II secretory pathway predicted ATPase ExeA
MINSYFGFTRNPFSRNTKPDNLFRWNNFENLIKRLEYFLTEGGIFILTGGIGGGKTTALRAFSLSLNPNAYRVIYMSDTVDSKKDFYASILNLFGLVPSHYAGDSRRALRIHLEDMTRSKRQTPIIILDEAQNIPGFILEEVRLLLNSEYDSRSLVHFILSGHKMLRERLSLHENEALRQRVYLKFHLNGLSLEETCAYIHHRLDSAGGTAQIFTDSVLAKIHEESQGIPRMINKICHSLLLAACSSEKKIIDDLIFTQAKNEWQ